MADYRLYFLDVEDRVDGSVAFECSEDGEALILAQQHRDGRAMELWMGPTLVAHIPKHIDGPTEPPDDMLWLVHSD